MASKDKTNPRKIPATQADVIKAEKRGRLEGAEFMFTVIAYVCKDKLLIDEEKLRRLGPEIDYFCDSLKKGYVNYNDLRRAQLEEGYSVHIRG